MNPAMGGHSTEQPFAHWRCWGLVRNIRHGSANEVHRSDHTLLHFAQFRIQGQVRSPPYRPWEHGPRLSGHLLLQPMGCHAR